ncbi:uncharacterized protein LOC120339728 [Styela clava]
MKYLMISAVLLVLMLRGTDAAIKAPGWKHCVHPLHALPGQWNKIVSPGFPNGINTQIQCSWMITSNPGYRIKLAFHTLNVTGSRKSCFTQFVEILDYKIGHSAGKFCGASRPGDYVSWGTRVRFDLQGDTSGEKTKGFDLRYKATKEPGGFKTSWTFPLKPKKGGTKKSKKPKAGKPKKKNKGPESSAFVKPRRPAGGGSSKPAGGARGPPKKATPVESPSSILPPGQELPPVKQPKASSPRPSRPPAPRTPAPGSRIDFRPPPPLRQGPVIYGQNTNRRGVDHGHSNVITVAEEEDEPLNIYIIAGVAAGGVVSLTIIFILMKVCIFDKNKKRKQRRKEQERAKSAAAEPNNLHMSTMPGGVPEQYMTEQIVPQHQSYHHMQHLPMMSQTISRHQYPHVMYPPMHISKSRTAPAMMAPPGGLKSSRSRARSSRSRVSRKDEMRRSKSRSSMRNSRSQSSMRRSKSRSMQAMPNMEGWIMVDPHYQPNAVIKNPYPQDGDIESSDLSSSSGWASDSTDSYRPKSQRRKRLTHSLPRMRSQPPTYESATGRPFYVIEKSRDFDEGYDTGKRTNGAKSVASKKRRERSRNSKRDRRRKYSQ